MGNFLVFSTFLCCRFAQLNKKVGVKKSYTFHVSKKKTLLKSVSDDKDHKVNFLLFLRLI